MPRLVRYASLVPAPWKNGGGSTTTIAVSPDGAGLDDFDWRISLATIDREGPFSSFPGVDRTLALVRGGIELRIDGERTLLDEGQAIAFAGELPVHARLRDRGTTDFNVMTRRARWRHTLERVHVVQRAELEVGGDVTVVFVAEGGCISTDLVDEQLALYDLLVLGPSQGCAVTALDAVLLVTRLTLVA